MAQTPTKRPKTFTPNWDEIMKVLGHPKQEAVYTNRSMDPESMDGSWDMQAAQKGLGMRRVAADIGQSNTEIQTPTGFVFICECGYARRVVENAKVLAETLIEGGLDVVSGGTDNHLMLVDLRKKNATGKRAEAALGRAYITCNKNGIPFDPQKPAITSGVRLGTPACTTRGFGIAEFQEVGDLIVEVLDVLSQKSVEADSLTEGAVREKVKKLVGRFPIYQE